MSALSKFAHHRALSYVAILLAVELLAWAWLTFRVKDPQTEAAKFRSSEIFDLYTGTRLQPRQGGLILNMTLPCVSQQSEFRIDEHGLHSPSPGLSIAKSQTELRVALFGGSKLFGQGVSDTYSTTAAVLERKLRAEYRDARVINAAMVGFLASSEFNFYLTKISAFQPDIVIAVAGLNDGYAASDARANPYKRSEQVEIERAANAALLGPAALPSTALVSELIKRTHAGRAAELIGRRYLWTPTEPAPAASTLDPDPAGRSASFLTILDDFHAVVERRGAAFVATIEPSQFVAYTPSSEDLACLDKSSFQHYAPTVRDFTRLVVEGARSRPWLRDLTTMFAQTSGVYVDYAHLNGRGQTILADALFDIVVRLKPPP